jgi:hypothetical protein
MFLRVRGLFIVVVVFAALEASVVGATPDARFPVVDAGTRQAAARKPPPKKPRKPSLVEVVFPDGIRSLDGSGNNVKHPNWGRAFTLYTRVAGANYADGLGAMVGGPSPRYVSNRIFNDIAQNLFSENNVTEFAPAWGQFLDHTFGLRQVGSERIPIQFDSSDPLEDFVNSFGAIDFARTPAAPNSGATSPRAQINTVNSFINAWSVYGGTLTRLEWLREGPVDGDMSNNGPHLVTGPNRYLPRATARGNAAKAPAMELQGRLMGAPDAAVVAGDVRANENIALTSMHTLFMREHNRIVNELPRSLPAEVRFQIARRVVGAEIQYITYNEFLPALGVKLDAYTGYKPNVNPSLANEFAVVGYRAHSLIHGELEIRGDLSRFPAEKADALRALGIVIQVAGDDVRMEVPLNVAFGNPDLLPLLGLAPVLSTLARDPQYKNDEQFDDQLRSVLFQVPAPGVADPSACLDGSGLPNCFNGVVDLGAIDIARARDHGVPYYNDLRAAYGLPRKESFAAITGESTEQFPTTDPLIDAANPLADRNILDFVQLLDRAGNGLDPRTGAAGSDAVVGFRRTSLAARL